MQYLFFTSIQNSQKHPKIYLDEQLFLKVFFPVFKLFTNKL